MTNPAQQDSQDCELRPREIEKRVTNRLIEEGIYSSNQSFETSRLNSARTHGIVPPHLIVPSQTSNHSFICEDAVEWIVAAVKMGLAENRLATYKHLGLIMGFAVSHWGRNVDTTEKLLKLYNQKARGDFKKFIEELGKLGFRPPSGQMKVIIDTLSQNEID